MEILATSFKVTLGFVSSLYGTQVFSLYVTMVSLEVIETLVEIPWVLPEFDVIMLIRTFSLGKSS